ncbi:hypothetical protein U8V72_21105 [Priestia filamentosa]|uniref:hypothetical protein n=1 Tax=Priestia filamentosa TaxID=1402861 RepID=UPI00397E1084
MKNDELKKNKKEIGNSIAIWLIGSCGSTLLFNYVLTFLGFSLLKSASWGFGVGIGFLTMKWVKHWNVGRKLKKQELEKERFFNYLNEYTSSK